MSKSYMVDIVLKDGTPKLASVSAENLDEATELVIDWADTLSACGDAETEEFFRNIASLSITPVIHENSEKVSA